ncbi:hypothetical protein IW262DRAFT_1292884 [Armillaria fumosa]|nr:hypothetical protein IW262DRAFT_1292884 [Armillaria fumosa]
MSSQIPVAVPSLGMTLGVVYICATISAMQVGFVFVFLFTNYHSSLFGITYTQVIRYHKKYPNDWWIFRYSVTILWIFDAFHVVLSTHMIYHYLIDLFGDYDGLYHIVCFNYRPPFVMVIVIGVQGWPLFPSDSVLDCGSYLHSSCRYSIPDFKALSVVEGSVWVIHSIPPFSDFIITLSMCYYLHKSRQACGLSKASDKLLGMMRLGVISGLATSICSLLILITYLAWPNTLIFFGIDLILPKRELFKFLSAFMVDLMP